jgi:biopolymer transport protein ExbD
MSRAEPSSAARVAAMEVSMAVSVEGPRGGGRRRSVDSQLNLVPYIDLLTCMIAFLLMTAIWTQLAQLHVRQKGQGESGREVTAQPEVDVAVVVHADGFALVVERHSEKDQRPLPFMAGDYDYERLAGELRTIKRSFPDKSDIRVLSEDGIHFESLVKTMDIAIAAGFPSVSLLDAGAPL